MSSPGTEECQQATPEQSTSTRAVEGSLSDRTSPAGEAELCSSRDPEEPKGRAPSASEPDVTLENVQPEQRERFVKVTLPGLRWDFFGVAKGLVGILGEVVSGPEIPDGLFKRAPPPFLVKLASRFTDDLPDVVTLIVPHDGEGEEDEEHLVILDYPDLPQRCRICGSKDHVQAVCPVECPWRQKLAAEKKAPKPNWLEGFLECQAFRNRGTQTWVTWANLVRLDFFPEMESSDVTKLKAGLVIRRGLGGKEPSIWLPNLREESKRSIPLRPIRMSKEKKPDPKGIWCLVAQAVWGMVAKNMLVHLEDQDAVEELEMAMDRVHCEFKVVSHRMDSALTFMFFLGVVEVADVCFDTGDGWQDDWISEPEFLKQILAPKGENDINLATKIVARMIAQDMGWAGVAESLYLPGFSKVKEFMDDTLATREDICTCSECATFDEEEGV